MCYLEGFFFIFFLLFFKSFLLVVLRQWFSWFIHGIFEFFPIVFCWLFSGIDIVVFMLFVLYFLLLKVVLQFFDVVIILFVRIFE